VRRSAFIAAGSLAAASRIAPASALVPRTSLRDGMTTRAEASTFTETSSLADVEKFFAELDQRGAPISHGSIGKSFEGRDIPYVVAARPMVRTPAQALALRRPIVFVQATIDASKVEGKEAILAIVRDLCLSPQKTLLEDLVLVIVPILNVDGNEHLGAGYLEAPEQNGPARVGTRTSAQGIELDGDFVRAEAPETRALLRFIDDWRPDVFVDLTSSGGSFHDFGATFAPSLHPAAYYGGTYVRDRMLPAVRKEMHEKFGIETFPFGRFGRSRALPEPPPATDVENFGWFPRDYRPRLGTNYMGLRGILAVLVSSYAHDTLERRIFTTRAFVETIFGFCSDNDDEVSAASHTTDRWIGGTVPVRATLPAVPTSRASIAFENLALDSSPDHEAGVPLGFKRTGTYGSATLPVYERYVGVDYRMQPKAFIVPAAYARYVESSLHAHSIAYAVTTRPEMYLVQDYLVQGIEKSLVPANGHETIVLSGEWREKRSYSTNAGDLVIPGPQPLGPLVSVLLEPESDDGFFAWNLFDQVLGIGSLAPFLRVASAT
jgi:hypothetical protein